MKCKDELSLDLGEGTQAASLATLLSDGGRVFSLFQTSAMMSLDAESIAQYKENKNCPEHPTQVMIV